MINESKVEFSSGKGMCGALRFQVSKDSPWVVMAHGFGGTVALGLHAYAEKYCEANYNVLAFDYRSFGMSSGTPRLTVNVKNQLEDWRSAIHYVQQQYPKSKIIIWGTSFGGGHVASMGAENPENLIGIISQVPHVNGFASGLYGNKLTALHCIIAGLRDEFRQLTHRSPLYIPVTGKPGETATLTGHGEYEASEKLCESSGLDIKDNNVAARSVLQVSSYTPEKRAKRIKVPWLVQIATRDLSTPPKVARRAASKCNASKVLEYDSGHFEMYTEPLFSKVVSDQIRFLKENKLT